MFEAFLARLYAVLVRLHRIERREIREFRLWMEHTSNLLHLSVLVFVPLLIGVVTYLSNTLTVVSFLLFPPLAAGTYTLFADPEGRYSSPGTFVGGMTLGALSGWVALEVVSTWRPVPPAPFEVYAGSAALAIFLTGMVTWALDLEEPTAFSTALLALLIGGQRLEYVVGVALSSLLVASVFVVWRDRVYERRARYLYRTTRGDDNVLVPMRGTADSDGTDDPDDGDTPDHGGTPGEGSDGPSVIPPVDEGQEATTMFGGRIAAAHEAGKVVLLDVVDDEATALAERELLSRNHEGGAVDPRSDLTSEGGTSGPGDSPVDRFRSPGPGEETADSGNDGGDEESEGDDGKGPGTVAEERAVAEAATELEGLADRIERDLDVPCEVVVAVARGDGWTPGLVTRAARDVGCDLVVTPYEECDGRLSPFVRGLFDADLDVIAFRSENGRRSWKRAMVPVRRTGAVAHAMIDFARRLTGPGGHVSVCHCISHERQRRRAETMLADLVDAFHGGFETRVARAPIEEFLDNNAPGYDLVLVGASTDRTAASRFISPPTFQRLGDVAADVAIVHRGR